jgi:hypothetical protein
MTDISPGKFSAIPRQVSPALVPDISAGYCQSALVDESRMIITQIHSRSEMVAVLGTQCAIPPRNSNSNSCCQKIDECHRVCGGKHAVPCCSQGVMNKLSVDYNVCI